MMVILSILYDQQTLKNLNIMGIDSAEIYAHYAFFIDRVDYSSIMLKQKFYAKDYVLDYKKHSFK